MSDAEKFRTSSPSAVGLTEKERLLERKAVRKLDYAVLPVMTMFYLLSFLVRWYQFDYPAFD